jgi:hypothetical protein
MQYVYGRTMVLEYYSCSTPWYLGTAVLQLLQLFESSKFAAVYVDLQLY